MGFLRLILALSVVATHAGSIFGTNLFPGDKAVEIFFVVSGFYMALILSKKYAGREKIMLFYGNRFLRLYPTYVLTIILAWLLFGGFWILRGVPSDATWIAGYRELGYLKVPLIVANWTMIGLDVPSLFSFDPRFHGFAIPGLSIWNGVYSAKDVFWLGDSRTIPQAWSLGMEIWFYLLVPWLITLKNRTIGLFAVASLLFRLWLLNKAPHLAYWLFPSQFFWFLIGVLLYRFYASKSFCPLPHRLSRSPVLLLGFCFVSYPWLDWSCKAIAMQVLCCLAVPWIFWATKSSVLDQHTGNLSYPIYMIHMLVYLTLKHSFTHISGTLVAIGTVLLALTVNFFIENPLEQWRARRVANFDAHNTRDKRSSIVMADKSR